MEFQNSEMLDYSCSPSATEYTDNKAGQRYVWEVTLTQESVHMHPPPIVFCSTYSFS